MFFCVIIIIVVVWTFLFSKNKIKYIIIVLSVDRHLLYSLLK